jgi:hypothetical protein
MRRLAWLIVFLLVIVSVSHAQARIFTGTIEDNVWRVVHVLDVPRDGLTLNATMTATGGDLDPYLRLLDPDGEILAENDDRAPGDLNATLIYSDLPQGEYRLEATRYNFNLGETAGPYEVSITLEEPAQLRYDVSGAALAEAGYPAITPLPESDRMVLVYLAGDNAISEIIAAEAESFRQVAADNVLILVDDGVTPRVTDGNETLFTFDDADLSDGETLAQFVTWGASTFPAERYALVISSIGSAWDGFGAEADRTLSPPEITAALEAARDASGIPPFDLVIANADFMSNVEFLTTLAPHAQTAVATPQIMLEPAFDITLVANSLLAQAEADVIGQRIIAEYVASVPANDDFIVSAAVIDLRDWDTVTTALDALAEALRADPEAYAPAVQAALADAYTYGLAGADGMPVDVGVFLSRLRLQLADDDPLLAALDPLQTAIREVVVARSAANSIVAQFGLIGLNVTFAPDDDYRAVPPLDSWRETLTALGLARTRLEKAAGAEAESES